MLVVRKAILVLFYQHIDRVILPWTYFAGPVRTWAPGVDAVLGQRREEPKVALMSCSL